MRTKKKTRAPYGSVKAAREAAAAAKKFEAVVPAPKSDFSGAITALEKALSDSRHNRDYYAKCRDSEQKRVDVLDSRIMQLTAAVELLKANSASSVE